MLEDEDIREKEGKEMEILRMATEKAKLGLYNYHSYADGGIDKPFLTPESVELNND
jgi:hypothetical protein